MTTHRLLMLDLFDELLQGHLAGRDLAPKELLEELGAAQAGDVGSPLLGDEALRVPLDAGGCPHLSCELFGGQVERGKDAGRQFVGDRGHRLLSRSLVPARLYPWREGSRLAAPPQP